MEFESWAIVANPLSIFLENILLFNDIFDCYFGINNLTKKATLIMTRPNSFSPSRFIYQ